MFIVNEKEEGLIKYGYFTEDTEKTTKSLPKGKVYKTQTIKSLFSTSLAFIDDTKAEKLIEMNSGQFSGIANQLDFALSAKCIEVHKDFGYINKLGCLLYGPPGTGKTSYVKLLVNKLVQKYNCIGLTINPVLDDYINIIDLLREEDKDLPIILIMDEVDRYLSLSQQYQTKLIDFLDGSTSKNNVITIMITNNFHKLPKAITENRPSRVRIKEEIRKIPVEIIDSIVKEKLGEKYSKTIDIPKLAYKLQEEEVTMDQIKHILIDIACYGTKIETAIKEIKKVPVGIEYDDEY